MERGDLGFVGGNVKEVIGEDAGGDGDLGSEYAVLGDREGAGTWGDDPFVGGTDGPQIGTESAEECYDALHLGEDVSADVQVEVDLGGLAQLAFADAGVDLGHLAANPGLADLAGLVGAMASVDPVARAARDEALFHRPDHEAVAGVAAPESAVAVYDRSARRGGGEELLEIVEAGLAGWMDRVDPAVRRGLQYGWIHSLNTHEEMVPAISSSSQLSFYPAWRLDGDTSLYTFATAGDWTGRGKDSFPGLAERLAESR